MDDERADRGSRPPIGVIVWGVFIVLVAVSSFAWVLLTQQSGEQLPFPR